MKEELSPKHIEAQEPSKNPHKLWKQILGLAISTVIFSFFAGNIIAILFIIFVGIFTFFDAWVSGIYKDKNKKSFLNISPMAWGIVMQGLLIIAYPIYLLNRNKLRTKKGTNVFWILTIITGGLASISTAPGSANKKGFPSSTPYDRHYGVKS